MGPLRIIAVEDADDDFLQVEDYCHEVASELGTQAEVTRFRSLDEFALRLGEVEPDLMIVDLRLDASGGALSGWDAVKPFLTKAVVPVLVYSAFAKQEPPDDKLRNVLIARVEKGSADVSLFHSTLKGFARLKLRLSAEEERIADQFGKLTLETAGAMLGDKPPADLDEGTLSAMAVSRLASYLMNVSTGREGGFPPEAAFLYPPLEIPGYERCLFLGDVLKEKREGEEDRIWIVCSPSCDLAFGGARKPKVRDVLLLRAYQRYDEVPWLKCKADANARKSAAAERHRDGTVKMLKCPRPVLDCGHLLVSLKDYMTVPHKAIQDGLKDNHWTKLATLATPYAENLQNQFIGDLSRIATPVTASRDEEEKWLKEFVGG